MGADVRADLVEFITTNYLFGDTSRLPGDDDSLLEAGILDSTGVLELIEFLEAGFGIEVAEDETVPENLGSVAGLLRYVLRKQVGSAAAAGPAVPAEVASGQAAQSC